jgi:hypothetical protein
VGFVAEDAADGGGRVEARCYCAAEGFYAGDCGGRGAGDDDVDFGG